MWVSVLLLGMPVVTLYLANDVVMCSCGRSMSAGKRVSNQAAMSRTLVSRFAKKRKYTDGAVSSRPLVVQSESAVLAHGS